MNAPARLATFGVAMLAALGAGAALGATIGPEPSSTPPVHHPATTVDERPDRGHQHGLGGS